MPNELASVTSTRRVGTVVSVFLLLIGLSPLNCTGGEPQPGDPPTTAERDTLRALGQDVFLATYREFAAEAKNLERVTATLAVDPTDPNRDAAQLAWADAMAVWQRAELMQLGPAATSSGVAGGKDLRDEIYSWPLVSPCRVDQETVAEAYNDPDVFGATSVNARGLDALEYLLFARDTGHACAQQSSIEADGTWNALSAEEVVRRRAKYAHAAAVDVRRTAEELEAAWDPDGGDFAGELAESGEGSAVYVRAIDGLNAITDALFYLDKKTKDTKVAIPAGITECTELTCPERVESKFAQLSKAHIVENLHGFGDVFFGLGAETNANGLDDLLVQRGASELAAEMRSDLDAAIFAVEGIEGALAAAVQNDHDAVIEAHAAIARVTTRFKGPVITTLELVVPREAAGDTD